MDACLHISGLMAKRKLCQYPESFCASWQLTHNCCALACADNVEHMVQSYASKHVDWRLQISLRSLASLQGEVFYKG